ncbi:MAG: TonB-dependent receptor [Pseudomonadota bacterium]
MAKSKLLLGTSALIAAATSAPAFAQGDEIIVTATKRPQTLQEVPVAVSVVDQSVVEKAQINDLLDLQTVVPSLRIGQLQNSSQTNFTIRGFGNGANNPGIEPSVGVFIDGVYRSRSSSAILDLPTMERVEVLRGPQSTLFGKNTSAGAISITTQQPQFDWGGSVEATYGNFTNVIFKGTLTGPITDTLAFRISGNTNNREGYYTNVVTGQDQNERGRYAIRGQLLWEPSDYLSFRAIADYNRIDENCCGAVQLLNGPNTLVIGPGVVDAPRLDGVRVTVPGLGFPIGDDSDPFAREVALDTETSNRLEGYGASIQADWDLETMQLTSITSYREQTDDSNTDVDFSAADVAQNPQQRQFETFTQEVRLASTGANRFNWLIGGFYFDETVEFDRDVVFGADGRDVVNTLGAVASVGEIIETTASGPGSAIALGESPAFFAPQLISLGFDPIGSLFAEGSGVFGEYVMDNRSFSIFGTVDFEVTDRLTLSGGVSYVNDRKEVVGTSTLNEAFSLLATTDAQLAIDAVGFDALQFFEPQVNFPDPSNPLDDGIVQDDAITYTTRIGYELFDAVNAYFTYATGWKAGAFNLSSDSQPPDPVTGFGRSSEPEDVRLFELGVKARFNGGYVNVALFDQKIEGFQSNIFTGSGFNLANAGEQSVRGFEVDALYSPIDALALTFAATYLDPKFDSFTMAGCTPFDVANCGNDEDFRDLSGTRVPGIHPLSVTTTATYTADLTDALAGFARLEYLHETRTSLIENIPLSFTRDVKQVNASVGFEHENGFELLFWGRNLTDNEYIIQGFPTVIQEGSVSGYANAPRTYGVTIRKKF